MNEFDEKAQTMHFEVVKEEAKVEKKPLPRSEDDEFTQARSPQTYEIHEKKEGGNGPLIAVICILSVLLICAIVVAFIVLAGINKGDEEPQSDEVIEKIYEEEEVLEEEEEVPEVKNVVISCELVFYPKTIKENKDGGYKIKVDFIDSDGEVFETKRIVVNEDTDIRLDGERLALSGFIYYLEETDWAEIVVFKGEIEEEDYVAMAISFETPPEVEEVELPEEIIIIDEEETEEDVEIVDGI